MPKAFEKPVVILGLIGVVVVAAVVVGLSRYKIKPRSLPIQNTSSANVNQTVNQNYPFSSIPDADLENKQVRIKTEKGDIVFTLDPKAGPLAAKNFYYLTQRGFYNGLVFWRVEPDFVIQGGDPTGTGRGGPGYQFNDDPVSQSYVEGTVAMANSGPNTNGSQFFICKGPRCVGLGPNYSIFGHVTSGMDVVRRIQTDDKMETVTIESAS